QPAFRADGDRPAHHRAGRAAIAGRSYPSRLSASAPGSTHRSDGSAPLRVEEMDGFGRREKTFLSALSLADSARRRAGAAAVARRLAAGVGSRVAAPGNTAGTVALARLAQQI